MIPVVSYFQGDIVPTVSLADELGSVEKLATECAVHSVGRRVPPRDQPIQVTFNGEVLDPRTRVSDAGIHPLDAIYLAYQRGVTDL
jgi:toluene monooxygenase system protein B